MRDHEAIEHILEKMRQGLPSTLTYHSVEHTLEVMKSAQEIAESENISDHEMKLLRTAVAYHDCGFLRTYANHEDKSCEIAQETLPDFGYSKEDIEIISGLIQCTKVPQRASSKLGRIICDADLDYLGKDNYSVVANTLYEEMSANGIEMNDKKWLDLQISFLESQSYFTEFSILRRSEKKDQVLKGLKKVKRQQYGDFKS